MNAHLQKLAYSQPVNPYSVVGQYPQSPYYGPAPYYNPPQFTPAQPAQSTVTPQPAAAPQQSAQQEQPQEPAFGLMDGAELAMDVGTSFIPFGGAIWNGLKAGYHGLTGQHDKMKSDLGWAAAGLIPFSGAVKGLAKTVGVGSKFLKSSPRIAAAAPHILSAGGNAAAGTAATAAINHVAPTPPPPPSAEAVSQFSGGNMDWAKPVNATPQ